MCLNFYQARNQGGTGKFPPPLEKCIGYRLKLLDIVQKIWTPLRKLFALPGDPSWLRAWFLPQMKIPNWKDSLCQGWRDLWMLLFRAKRIRCLMPLAHNGSCVFGAKRLFLASMSCVKVFRTFKAMSFQDLHWLQKLGSCKASFRAKVV